jgi:sodium transport system permease protein
VIRTLWTVFRKELLENVRDRRTMLSALVLGPLGAPVLFAVMMNVTLERGRERAERPLTLAVAGEAAAPNLVAYLRREGVRIRVFPGDGTAAAAAVSARVEKLVLTIPEDFATRLRAGEPAKVLLYADTSDNDAGADRARTEALLRAYGGQIAAWRLQVRGLSPSLVQPLVVDEVDVSTPAARALALLGMLSYFIVFATLMGGLYVAIDATAGERERGSLEPLLTLPVPRCEIVYGKVLAAAAFMALSLALVVSAFAVSLRFTHLDSLGMAVNFGVGVALSVIAVMLPFVFLGAALMTLVAAFTRSFREAQSWLAALILVPTLPIMFAALYQLPSRTALMWVPSLSQHLLIQSLRSRPSASRRCLRTARRASTSASVFSAETGAG